MANNLALFLEAEKRGILPPDKKALLQEARKRGLVPGQGPKDFAQTATLPMTEGDRPIAQPQKEQYKSALWPLSEDAQGNAQFDSSAGVLGMLRDAVTLPGDVLTGKTRLLNAGETGGRYSPEIIDRSLNFAVLATPLPAATRAGMRVTGGPLPMKRTIPEAPSSQVLNEVGGAGLDRMRSLGVDYSADAVKGWANDVQRILENSGSRDRPNNSPNTFAVLRDLANPPEGAVVDLNGLISARRELQGYAGNTTNTLEAGAAKFTIKRLDKFIKDAGDSVTAGSGRGLAVADIAAANGPVVRGDAAEAGRLLRESNANIAAGKRSERLQGAEYRAEKRTESANSGHNLGNTLKGRLTDLLLNPKQKRGFSPEEIASIEKVVEGTWGQAAAREIGNRLGGGGGAASTLVSTLGAAGGVGAGAFLGLEPITSAAIGASALPTAGAISRGIYNKSVQKAFQAVDAKVRQRSPLYERMLKTAPLTAKNQTAKEAFLKSLLMMLNAEAAPTGKQPAK